jgi:hypothetical protein
MLRSLVESVTVDQFLPILSTVNQEEPQSTIMSLDSLPEFYWVFKNKTYLLWRAGNSSDCHSHVLWLSGPPERKIQQVSAYIIHKHALKTERRMLYFSCSAAARQELIVTCFIQTLLYQFLRCSLVDKQTPIVRGFLDTVVEAIIQRHTGKQLAQFLEGNSEVELIKNILDRTTEELWTALEKVLAGEQERQLLIVVDGLDRIQHGKHEFIKGVGAFVEHLQRQNPMAKILLTSKPEDEIKEVFDGFQRVMYDEERKRQIPPSFYET